MSVSWANGETHSPCRGSRGIELPKGYNAASDSTESAWGVNYGKNLTSRSSSLWCGCLYAARRGLSRRPKKDSKQSRICAANVASTAGGLERRAELFSLSSSEGFEKLHVALGRQLRWLAGLQCTSTPKGRH